MSIPYTYWQDDSGWYVGYWSDYPDYTTQGKTLEELEYMLRDLRTFINSGELNEKPLNCGMMEFA